MVKTTDEIRLRHLKIINFKAIDSLELDFPEPLMSNDPDILVIGSKNGVGKTSVLEACSLLFLAIVGDNEAFEKIHQSEVPVDIYDLLIRAGKQQAIIEGTFENKFGEAKVKVILNQSKRYNIKENIKTKINFRMGYVFSPETARKLFLLPFLGLSVSPMMLSPFLYFHSYRKTREGDPELKDIVDSIQVYPRRGSGTPAFLLSDFKDELVRLIMSNKDVYEDMDVDEAKAGLDKLNELVKYYTGGRISEKLRPTPENKMGIRIIDPGSDESFPFYESYPFDGLSSGQKEMITTLFTIWWHTRVHPGIILIDEPELHMNAEWHRMFINQLHELAPQNQYIISTHSEDIVSAVDKEHRVILRQTRDNDND
ncbi:ATP-binding protein [bacterium]|nr:ATP-binding protein [bacterium]